ncbi:uncharacterized protein LOC131301947 isoform X3 [Rhododendron vialii]|uniref:uncharacterized protein LOC131301947 isoform X3 n=1 Tax=Rhododendron vialii TaxID=182163 RepID=UPI00265FA191|nr:uncharacterized protein LOC131301947 isoform X3 [Rhododendron vialii]
MAEVLVLDAAISDWVLIPLSVVMMVLIGFLGYVISNLTDSSESPDDNSKIVKTYMPLQFVVRARNLRAKSFRANEVFDLRSRGRGRGAPLLYHMVTKQARDLQISGWGYFWSFLVIMVVSTCVEFFLVGNLVLLFHSVDYMKFYSCTSH